MYRILLRLLPEALANILLTLWYILIVFLIYLFFSVPQAGFRYINI